VVLVSRKLITADLSTGVARSYAARVTGRKDVPLQRALQVRRLRGPLRGAGWRRRAAAAA
jgi:hypothetical protein